MREVIPPEHECEGGQDLRMVYLKAMNNQLLHEQCAYILDMWPGWHGGLEGWLKAKPHPMMNASPWLAARDMMDLREATMKEF